MVQQRNPRVGDIVESRLWFPEEPIYMRYLKVTNLVEMKDYTVVQMKPFLDRDRKGETDNLCEESMLFFEMSYAIIEGVNEKTFKVLYGSRTKRI